MEQARLVRRALSTAIDRADIVTAHTGGLGLPLYSEYMGPGYRGWDAGRSSGCFDIDGTSIPCTGTSTATVMWELADGDSVAAGALLDLAGYSTRADFGTELEFGRYCAEIGCVSFPISDAIIASWTALGITVNVSDINYGGVVSPRIRDRIHFQPIFKNGDVNSNAFPLDWPYPPTDSSITRPGWGVGFESPYLSAQNLSIRASQDKAFRELEHLKTADYILFWQLYNGVVQVPRGAISNSRIAAWPNPRQHYGGIAGLSSPEFIELN